MARLDAPTPLVAMATPGLPVSLPSASAIKEAPDSWRVETRERSGCSSAASRISRKLSPGTVYRRLTPARAITSAATYPAPFLVLSNITPPSSEDRGPPGPHPDIPYILHARSPWGSRMGRPEHIVCPTRRGENSGRRGCCGRGMRCDRADDGDPPAGGRPGRGDRGRRVAGGHHVRCGRCYLVPVQSLPRRPRALLGRQDLRGLRRTLRYSR